MADEVGLNSLTLAALATRLGVRQPSLYKHIDSMAGLHRDIAVHAKRDMGEVLARASVGHDIQRGGESADALGLGVVASAPILQGRLASGLPDEVRSLFPSCTTDAQCALRFASSLPGVATVLAGMRSTGHVRENINAWAAE